MVCFIFVWNGSTIESSSKYNREHFDVEQFLKVSLVHKPQTRVRAEQTDVEMQVAVEETFC